MLFEPDNDDYWMPELAPRHSTADSVINNINAQQKVSDELKPSAIIFT